MPTYQGRVAASTAVVGSDLFSGQIWARTPQARALDSFALVGSAVLGDAEVDIMLGELRIANFFNSRTGVTSPNIDDIIRLGGLFVPGGALLRAIVRDAAATNPLAYIIALRDVRGR
jgi:hypothetical protein